MENSAADVGIPRPDRLRLHPFVGLRYHPGRVDVGSVLAPPYDVIDATERERLAQQHEFSVVRLTLPEGGEERYRTAAERLTRWREDEILVSDPGPALYVYEQATSTHVQRGLVGALALTPAEDGIVLPHENTMAGPVADRLALLRATAANLEPIFCVYDGGGAASAAVADVDATAGELDAVDPAGVRHRLWRITDRERLAQIDADLAGRRALIADGHHRYATYLAYQAEQHAAGRGIGPWDRGLTFLVDTGRFGPEILPIHRVVRGLALAEALERARAAFDVRRVDSPRALDVAAAAGPAFIVSDAETFHLLQHPQPQALSRALPADRSPAWRGLHVNVAHHLLFRDLWSLPDREGVIDYVHDEAAALTEAKATGGLAVLLAATPVSAVAAVAAAGERMPRKSTLFTPKPATGIVMRALPDDRS